MSPNVPFWSDLGVIRGEPLLLIREAASGKKRAPLLFAPSEIVGVRHPDGRALPATLFRIDGKMIVADDRAEIPCLSEEELYRDEFVAGTAEEPPRTLRHPHFCEGHYFQDLQILVDYKTDERWDGPVPESRPSAIPVFRSQGGRVVLIGDSISEGANASSLTGVAPFQPPFIELFARDFRELTGWPLEMCNLAKGGKTSLWGLSQAEAVIEAEPDVVIIAFGMNEPFDGITPDQFAENIETLMRRIEIANPEVEFIIIAGMSPNPEWYLATTDVRDEIFRRIQSFASSRVAVCDVRSTWDELVRRKGFWSVTGNGLNHPNDYGHRLYADCLLKITTN